jgi:hypothetical protein
MSSRSSMVDKNVLTQQTEPDMSENEEADVSEIKINLLNVENTSHNDVQDIYNEQLAPTF